MTTRERQVYIAKVKRFARSKGGLKKIEKIAPEVAQIIRQHPEYLDIPQYLNDRRVAANYANIIFGIPFYSGSSGNAYLRICEHAYNVITDATAYGGVYQNGIPVSFKIYATGVESPDLREFIEFKVIDRLRPLLQYTDPDSDEYGTDKPIPTGKNRENMRPDICITVPLRFKRFAAAKAAYQAGEEKKE